MKHLILIICVCFTATTLWAQADSNSVVIYKDARVDQLIKKQIQINEETTRDARKSGPGFRIQVINTNDRTKAIEAKTKVYQLFPELKAYLLYQAPYFRLRVGNFKTKQDADPFLKSLSRHFTGNVFIVPDVVEIKPEKTLEEN